MNFNDLLNQLNAVNKMGGISKIASFIPGVSKIINKIDDKMTSFISKQIAIISSMTKRERLSPNLILEKSRLIRISKGSGTSTEDVLNLVERLRSISDNFKKSS